MKKEEQIMQEPSINEITNYDRKVSRAYIERILREKFSCEFLKNLDEESRAEMNRRGLKVSGYAAESRDYKRGWEFNCDLMLRQTISWNG